MTAIVTRMGTTRPVEGLIMTIIVRAEIYVADSRLDEFRKVATQLAAAAGAEAGTIQYRWFSSKDQPAQRTTMRCATVPAQHVDQPGRVTPWPAAR